LLASVRVGFGVGVGWSVQMCFTSPPQDIEIRGRRDIKG
jgi:hypothetical protein